MRRAFAALSSTCALAFCVATAAPAAAATSDTPPSDGGSIGEIYAKGVDTGQRVDLSQPWVGFSACYAYDDGKARCYSSEAEMEQREAARPEEPSIQAANCGGYYGRNDWLRLYENRALNQALAGRVLSFKQTNTIQNLTDWNFNDQTSSISNQTGCDVWFHDNINGGGATGCFQNNSSLGDLTGPYRSNPFNAWNDSISSFEIKEVPYVYC